jgi:branched-chain amino acid transport system permease protein
MVFISEKKIDAFFEHKFGSTSGFYISELFKSILTAVWFMFFTFPLMVIRVNTIEKTIDWRWMNMVYIGITVFILSAVWRELVRRQKGTSRFKKETEPKLRIAEHLANFQRTKYYLPSLIVMLVAAVIFPVVGSLYQTTVMSTALIYVMLGLGLNIVVGLGGMLNLGYVAFYIVGAYSYALLNHHFGLSFWYALPIGALLATISGIIIAVPLLHLRGDYLAIVTLAFAEIMRLILENWGSFTFGASGIRNIARPDFFGISLKLPQMAIYIYYIILALAIFTIFVIYRLENSRVGRALQAMREDEMAISRYGYRYPPE